MVALSRVWNNGLYTMVAKPIKSLELHYTMIQFLIIITVCILTDRPQPAQISNSVVVPLWKKELAEKRKQRVDVNSVQALNKENELRTSPEIPPWKKELAERKTRRSQPIVIPKGSSEDSAEQVPSFMREFEKKKRTFPRGNGRKESRIVIFYLVARILVGLS